MSRGRCPNCGFSEYNARSVCPNCGYTDTQENTRTPLWLRLGVGLITFLMGAFGSCVISLAFANMIGKFFMPVMVLGGVAIAIVVDFVLVNLRTYKPVLPDNDIRLAPPEDRNQRAPKREGADE